jgi:hypothetical protein
VNWNLYLLPLNVLGLFYYKVMNLSLRFVNLLKSCEIIGIIAATLLVPNVVFASDMTLEKIFPKRNMKVDNTMKMVMFYQNKIGHQSIQILIQFRSTL